jgi:hypothetical protein
VHIAQIELRALQHKRNEQRSRMDLDMERFDAYHKMCRMMQAPVCNVLTAAPGAIRQTIDHTYYESFQNLDHGGDDGNGDELYITDDDVVSLESVLCNYCNAHLQRAVCCATG